MRDEDAENDYVDVNTSPNGQGHTYYNVVPMTGAVQGSFLDSYI